ncbi:MAG: hypothetical protein F6K41_31575, partial [Symploca sp. SIO3E6]|nr:hypothetical protein [Caldora sp. SIO3E6]
WSGSFANINPQPVSVENKIQFVVVSLNEEKQLGLVVEHILDIVEEHITIKGPTTQEGVQFSAVIQNRITEVLDVETLIGDNG